MKNYFYISVLIIATLFSAACGKEEPIIEEPLETDPAKIILGKWMNIEHNDGSYSEYLLDSVYRQFDPESERYSYWKYWIDSIIVYEYKHDTNMVFTIKCDYEFSDNNNRLRLEIINANADQSVAVLQRID